MMELAYWNNGFILLFVTFSFCHIFRYGAYSVCHFMGLLLIGFVAHCRVCFSHYGSLHYIIGFFVSWICHTRGFIAFGVCHIIGVVAYWVCPLLRSVGYWVCHILGFVDYLVCHIVGFVPCWICCIMGFVAFGVWHILSFVTYWVCHALGFVAYWVCDIVGFVAYLVCLISGVCCILNLWHCAVFLIILPQILRVVINIVEDKAIPFFDFQSFNKSNITQHGSE